MLLAQLKPKSLDVTASKQPLRRLNDLDFMRLHLETFSFATTPVDYSPTTPRSAHRPLGSSWVELRTGTFGRVATISTRT
jgi:hypothetical protein